MACPASSTYLKKLLPWFEAAVDVGGRSPNSSWDGDEVLDESEPALILFFLFMSVRPLLSLVCKMLIQACTPVSITAVENRPLGSQHLEYKK